MKLAEFNTWYYQQARDYWKDPEKISHPDKCLQKLDELKTHVDDYLSNQSEAFIWFKRIIPAMLSVRMSLYHIHYDDPNIPLFQTKYTKFTDLLGAFLIELPSIESLFSTYLQDPSAYDPESGEEPPPCIE
jgi:hypothetical protein